MRTPSTGPSGVVFVLLAGLAAPAPMAGRQAVEEPSLRVAVIVDGSGTFAPQRDAAVARTIALLDSMAATPLHRWESGADHVTLISLDALPEVIWQGTLRQLKTLDHDRWAARFDARSDFAHCTDVAAAFRLAAAALAGGSGLVHRYVFAFSDLIHEPPTTSVRSCAAPRALPPATFPWDQLADVSVSVFWAPPDQVLAWRRAVDERALDASFSVHSVSESTEIPLVAPARPTVELSEEDTAADRARYSALAWRGLTWLGTGVAGILVLTLVLVVALGLARRRARRAAGRPVRGPRRPSETGRRPGSPPARRSRRSGGRPSIGVERTTGPARRTT